MRVRSNINPRCRWPQGKRIATRVQTSGRSRSKPAGNAFRASSESPILVPEILEGTLEISRELVRDFAIPTTKEIVPTLTPEDIGLVERPQFAFLDRIRERFRVRLPKPDLNLSSLSLGEIASAIFDQQRELQKSEYYLKKCVFLDGVYHSHRRILQTRAGHKQTQMPLASLTHQLVILTSNQLPGATVNPATNLESVGINGPRLQGVLNEIFFRWGVSGEFVPEKPSEGIYWPLSVKDLARKVQRQMETRAHLRVEWALKDEHQEVYCVYLNLGKQSEPDYVTFWVYANVPEGKIDFLRLAFQKLPRSFIERRIIPSIPMGPLIFEITDIGYFRAGDKFARLYSTDGTRLL